MLNARSYILLGMILVIIGCGQRHSTTVGEGFFQKRKLQSGWHIDLGLRNSRMTQPEERSRKEHRGLAEQIAPEEQGSYKGRSEETIAVADVSEPLAQVGHVTYTSPRAVQKVDLQAVAEPENRDRDTSNIMPRKRFNVLATPALLFAAAGITFAFTTNSTLLVAGTLVVGLVLAAISLRRIRSKEQSGKGFALTALILGVLAALITTMVIIRTGF